MTPPDRAPEPLSAAIDALEREIGWQLQGQAPVIDPMASLNRRNLVARFADLRRVALDAARDSRPVGEGLREALVDGDHEAGGDCARFNPHEHTGATAIRWLALPVLECAEELMGRTRCPAVQCCEPSIPPFGCHDCGHLFDAPCCCVNDPHKGANR